MKMLNVTLTYSDKYCHKQQKPSSPVWREEAEIKSEPDQGLQLEHTTSGEVPFPIGKNKLFWAKTQ